jgi:Icc protein
MLKATAVLLGASFLFFAAAQGNGDFRFAILGDRTGGAQPGVFEEAVRNVAARHPSFVVTVGDAIEGGNDATSDAEWNATLSSISPLLRKAPIFFTPGNHDVWSEASALEYTKHTQRPLHYSFDFGQAHFTVLDNSRTEQFSPSEMAYLESDLAAHAAQPLKFVFSHRPSWILQALLGDRKSKFQDIAEKYHVQYFIAGHIHEMLYFHVNGVNYISMPSAGGHLRNDKQYESGWFFAETEVEVHGADARFTIHELASPFGEGRVSSLQDWGAAGLVRRAEVSSQLH